jgi:hypothetical protein
LPEITFLNLNNTSDLIDKGIDVGLAFHGSAPDLGAIECTTVPGTVNEYPYIFLTSPINNSSITNYNTILKAEASDPDGSISKVVFYYDDKFKIDSATSYPWTCSWDNAPIGIHSIRAVATDNQGARSTSARIYVTIYPGGIINTSGNDILFPNPNDGTFSLFLTSPLKRACNVSVISPEGKIICRDIMAAEQRIKQFSFPELKPGIYLLLLASTEVLVTKLFVRQ